MKQRILTIRELGPRTPISPDFVLTKALEEHFRSIALSLEHGEYYADPKAAMISGWRQQQMEAGKPGEFVDYTIRLRIGSPPQHPEDDYSAQIWVDSVVDDGIDQ